MKIDHTNLETVRACFQSARKNIVLALIPAPVTLWRRKESSHAAHIEPLAVVVLLSKVFTHLSFSILFLSLTHTHTL